MEATSGSLSHIETRPRCPWPWYAGAMAPTLDVVTKKAWPDGGGDIVFEHALII
jgi:hypothetical protein